jgi:hypothetical protein
MIGQVGTPVRQEPILSPSLAPPDEQDRMTVRYAEEFDRYVGDVGLFSEDDDEDEEEAKGTSGEPLVAKPRPRAKSPAPTPQYRAQVRFRT